MSEPSPQPAAPEGALRQARDLGRRHGRAAVYWQIGDDGSPAAREFYRELLSGIATADPAITGLYAVPDLTARWDYDRDSLAAAREEFWLEAARLARRHLAPGAEDGTGRAARDHAG